MTLKVAVGTENPTKLRAVKEAFSGIFDEEVHVVTRVVETGVREQPMKEEETIQGAINRAKRCMEDEDLGVGIEGGIHENKFGYFLRAWVAIWNGTTLGIGGCASLQLPTYLVEQIRESQRTLGELMNVLMERNDVPEIEGAFGVFTRQLLPRKESFFDGIIVALAPFFREELYDVEMLKQRL